LPNAPEFSRFVAGCCHNATTAGAADGDRTSSKVRVVALFDRRKERIHVDVDDFSARSIGHQLNEPPAIAAQVRPMPQ